MEMDYLNEMLLIVKVIYDDDGKPIIMCSDFPTTPYLLIGGLN